MNRIDDNTTAIKGLFTAQIAACVLALVATLLFEAGLLGGMAWQVTLGIGIFVSYTLMQTPVFDRLFAATRTKAKPTPNPKPKPYPEPEPKAYDKAAALPNPAP